MVIQRRTVGIRVLAVALAVALVPVVAVVPQASAAVADLPSTRAATQWGPWHGSMSITSAETIARTTNSTTTRTGKGTYSNLAAAGEYLPGGDNTYRADVTVEMSDKVTVPCEDGDGAATSTSSWTYSGSSEGAVDSADGGAGYIGGYVVRLEDREADQVYLTPEFVVFNTTDHYQPCPPFSSQELKAGNDTLSFYVGLGGQAIDPLIDTDPDPAHLVGTTSWGLAHFPTDSPPYTYTAYEFTVTYDLRREPLGASWEWSVVDRMRDDDGDGVLDSRYVGGSLSSGLKPNQPLDVRLDACPASSVTWIVDGVPMATGCQAFVSMVEGRHDVTARTSEGEVTQTIDPQHYLIVGLGDSYGSGEGVPDKGGWDDKACHRSRHSSQAQAALALEKADDKSAVTFVHLACSGATTKNLYGPQSKPPGGGKAVPAQVATAARLTAGNTIDAVLLSLGGNDAHFSDIITNCAAYGKCPTSKKRLKDPVKAMGCTLYGSVNILACLGKTKKASKQLHDEVQGYLKVLPASFAKVADCLNGGRAGSCPLPKGSTLTVRSDRVLHSEYPALGQDDRGKFCDRELLALGSGIADEEFAWATNVVQWGTPGTTYRPDYNGRDPSLKVRYKGLNRVIRDPGSRGWTPVTGLFDISKLHGYCAKDSYVTSLTTSLKNQRDQFGAFHPNYKGQGVFGQIIGRSLTAKFV